jgi:threonine aldolase
VDAGVDALSFGGTKNGMACGEAVLFFPQGDGSIAHRAAARFPYLRKSTGHLLSKMRFASAPFAAALKDGAWLRHGSHANNMAKLLEQGLRGLGIDMRFPVQSNGVFASLPRRVHEQLRSLGYEYYLQGPEQWLCARFMMSFDTPQEKVESLLADVAQALGP